MKKLLITILAIALVSPLSVGAFFQGFGQYLGSPITRAMLLYNSTFALSSTMFIQSANDQVSISFEFPATTTIVAADLYIGDTGTMTGITLKFDIETVPSLTSTTTGTLVGGATASFAAPATSGWTGMQDLTSSATLSPNTPYVFVLKDGGGTAPTASNYTVVSNIGSNIWPLGYSRSYHYNGSTWNTNTANNANLVLKDSNGNYYGSPTSSAVANSAFRLYNGNYYGLNFRVGGYAYLTGVLFNGTSGGNVTGPMAVSLYQNKNLLETLNLATTSFNAGAIAVTWSQSYLMTPNTDYQITFNNTVTGSSGLYDVIKQAQINPTYSSLVYPANWYTFTGSSTPSTWTASTTEMSMITPMIGDPGTSFAPSGVGSGLIRIR